MKKTASDCHLDGTPIPLDQLCLLDSKTLAKIVGQQQPGEHLECSSNYHWSFQCLALEKLRYSNDFGEEPDGGWKQAYLRHAQSDETAVKNGSPEYAGRQKWVQHWCQDTRIYPLYVVFEEGQYRLWDGHHRLASAFWHEIETVYVFLGVPK